MTPLRLSLAIGVCVAIAGCDRFPFAACGQSVERAIDVEVTDSRTGQWIASGAFGFIQDGKYVDTLQIAGWRGSPPNDTITTLGAGLGRAGTYVVQIARPGYATWRRTGVRAREGTCGVVTTRLRATLEAR